MLSSMHARFFILDTYVNVPLREKVYLDEDYYPTNKRTERYLYYKDNKLLSNIVSIKSFKLNLKYKISEKVSVVFYHCIEEVNMACVESNLKNVFGFKNSLIVHKNYVMCLKPFYVNYKMVNGGKVHYDDTLVICFENIEFKLSLGDILICQIADVKEETVTLYKKEYTKMNNVVEQNNFEYNFNFNYQRKEFSESIIRYIIPPLLMVAVTIVISYLANRGSFIIFMIGSSISSMLGSLIMYFHKKQAVDTYNSNLEKLFQKKCNLLKVKIDSDLIKYYDDIDFCAYSQNVLGWKFDSLVNINQNISCNYYKQKFEVNYKNQLVKVMIDSRSISIVGKYAREYIYNLIIQWINIGSYERIVILCDGFNIFNKHVCYQKSLITKNSVVITDDELEYDCQTIYIKEKTASTKLIVNDEFKNIYNGETMFLRFLTNVHVLERIIQSLSRRKLANKVVLGKRDLNIGIKLNIEKDGPHGIVVGATGSGKSILLKTMIYELCLKYTTDELNICIVDFKGRSLILDVENLPHVVNTYSNLDDDNYVRIVNSIDQELIKRQKLLDKHKLSKYDKSIGIPKLVIIIDEFAELKSEAENITQKLTSVARIGRSLGVYLILSMQKATGVLNDDLRSNISYVLCLKVNTKQQSIEVVGSDKCFYFQKPGEAVLIKNNEEMFFNVFNCEGGYVNEPTILNGKTLPTYEMHVHSQFVNDASEEYYVWKDLFKERFPGKIMIDDLTNREVCLYEVVYSNYLIVGKEGSGKTTFVKTVLNDLECLAVVLSLDYDIDGQCAYFSNDVNDVPVLISMLRNSKEKCVLIIDDFLYFTNEELEEFIIDILNNKYSNIRVVLNCNHINSFIGRICKLFTNKFLLDYDDNSEVITLFHKRTELNINGVKGRGLTTYKGEIVLFQNCIAEQYKENKYVKLPAGYYYSDTFEEVDFSKSICIYDTYVDKIESVIYVNKSKCGEEQVKTFIENGYSIFSTCREYSFEYKTFKNKCVDSLVTIPAGRTAFYLRAN